MRNIKFPRPARCPRFLEEEVRVEIANSRQRPRAPRWTMGRCGVRHSAHHRKRCLHCGVIYPNSRDCCPVCGSKVYRLRAH